MIIAYLESNKFVPIEIVTENKGILKEALWIDLFSPKRDEIEMVETLLNLEMPTRADMEEIEISSRLYQEDGVLFMTATMFARSDMVNLKLDPVTFIFTHKQLITIRFIQLQSFDLFLAQLRKSRAQYDAAHILISLLEAHLDCLADILELTGHRLEHASRKIFQSHPENDTQKTDYSKILQELGMNGDLNSKTRESLVIFNRLISFFSQMASLKFKNDEHSRLSIITKDVMALSDHASFIANKVVFLLEATLGMVNIEQNNIIKIFSIAATIFLPPTLIASIYGMNFQFIPEFSWKYGYIYVLILMFISSWIPYKYFKYKKWL